MSGGPQSTSARVQRKRRERRERIVAAAVGAIAELGPGEFSLNQLARDLDYTPGALYWYFASKEALVLEVQRRVFTELATVIAEGRQRWKQGPHLEGESEATRCLYTLLRQAHFYLTLEGDKARIITFSLDPRQWLDEDHARELAPVLAELFRVSALGFVEAHELGVLVGGQPAHRAVQYWAALQGMIQTGKLARINPDLFHVVTLGVDSATTLLRGWGAPAEALERAAVHLAEDTAVEG
jgi:AcrR family transcriptional regulator